MGVNRNVAADPAMPEKMAIRAMLSPSNWRSPMVDINTNVAIILVTSCVFSRKSFNQPNPGPGTSLVIIKVLKGGNARLGIPRFAQLSLAFPKGSHPSPTSQSPL